MNSAPSPEQYDPERIRVEEVRREADEFMAAFDAIRGNPGLCTTVPNSEPDMSIVVTSENVDDVEARIILAGFRDYPELLHRVAGDPTKTEKFLKYLNDSRYTDAYKQDVSARLQDLLS